MEEILKPVTSNALFSAIFRHLSRKQLPSNNNISRLACRKERSL